mgnify:CR=1 FL=1|jgi:hypothetical protein
MNGTVGATIKKLQQIQAALQAGDTATVQANSQYHDYAVLFKSWFGSDIEPKIIESAIMYWFRDEDFKDKNKVYKYFMEA